MPSFTLQEVRDFEVAPASIALWWLGQSGFVMKSPGGTVLVLDPYLTDSCKAVGESIGLDMNRMVPPPMQPADLVGVDAYLLTHTHQDHLDSETLEGYRTAGGQGPYIAPAETGEKLMSLGVSPEHTRMVWPNREQVVGDFTVRATFAIPLGPDDLTHVGYLVRVEGGPTVYFTGDTSYHDLLPASVAPHAPDLMVTVINPAFRNLTPPEAAKFAKQLDVQVVIPCHHDLFPDNCQPPQMLRTCLILEGIGERYRLLEHGVPFVFATPAL